MSLYRSALLGTFFVAAQMALAPSAGAQQPVVPGLHGAHGLEPDGQGRVLLRELRCAACHSGPESLAALPVEAPKLESVGQRLNADYLRAFLLDPQATHPGTKMPDVLTGLAPEAKAEVVEGLTHFLVGLAQDEEGPAEISPRREGAAERGASLFHRIGCVACHGPRRSVYEGEAAPAPQAGELRLEHLTSKYQRGALADFLFEPARVRPGGRMPDMGLDRDEAESLEAYLLGDIDGRTEAGFTVDAALAAQGREAFRALGCAACHPIDGLEAASRAPLKRGFSSVGCLTLSPSKAPFYGLGADQIRALGAALDAPESVQNEGRVQETMVGLNCIACHDRSGYGGVQAFVDPYFESREPSLGDHARIPPSLTNIGAKLNVEWTRKVLFDGAAVRPYMDTRMPQFAAPELTEFPDQVASLDTVEPFPWHPYEGDESGESRRGGRELVGSAGVNCISCHNFNGKRSPNMPGMDLISTHERMQLDWFAAFLADPETHRPGIVMPASWPGGVAVHDGILGGDTHDQIQGIWFFLSGGRTARDPEGLLPNPSLLAVTDEVRTYRGRSGIAGFRGIAVGFPSGVNYAFDAQNGSLAGLWFGDYVHVRWDGQGAGDFRPAERATELARDVAVVRLKDGDEPWPLRPHVDEEHRTNPDPEYPRNRGYRFRGYALDEARVPTLLYSSGGVTIEDRSVAGAAEDGGRLTRTLRMSSGADDQVWFRVLAGSVEDLGDGVFQLGRVRVSVGSTDVVLRDLPAPAQGREVLLRLAVPKGTTEWTLSYELLR